MGLIAHQKKISPSLTDTRVCFEKFKPSNSLSGENEKAAGEPFALLMDLTITIHALEEHTAS